jgi:hypothetical protein
MVPQQTPDMILESVLSDLPEEQRRLVAPKVMAVIKAMQTTKTSVVASVRPDNSLESVFPYPLVRETGECHVCIRPFREHSYLTAFVDESHEAAAAKWFDSQMEGISKSETFIEFFVRTASDKQLSEKERIYFLREMQEKVGPRGAEDWQMRMHYQTQEQKLLQRLLTVLYSHANSQRYYFETRSELKERLLFDYRGDMERFKARWDRYAHWKYIQFWDLAKETESLVRGLSAKSQDMDAKLEDSQFMAMVMSKNISTTTTVQAPPKGGEQERR